MDEQRERSRAGGGCRGAHRPARVALTGAPTTFVGYEHARGATRRSPCREPAGRAHALVKLAESPFYAAGGGQISDVGTIECEDGDCRARVADVVRSGDDQAHASCDPAEGELQGGRARRRARRPRHAQRHDGQPHRHAPAARGAARSGWAPTCARRAPTSGPDKLRFDFTHGAPPEPPRSAATSRTRSTRGSSRTDPVRAARRRSTRPSAWGRWRCSARSTATSCAWSRSATARSRASCAAARTCARPRRSACSHHHRDARRRPTCAASRRSPGRGGRAAAPPRRAAARGGRRAAHAARAACPKRSPTCGRRREPAAKAGAASRGATVDVDALSRAARRGRRRRSAGRARRRARRQGAAGPRRPRQGEARRCARSCSAARSMAA